MTLKVTKNEGKAHTVLYIRDDGSRSWMQADDFFVLHDISHYVIEKTLGYGTAFFGMINNGMDLKDFENREKRKRITLTYEATCAENMANLFLMEQLQGLFEDFNRTLAEAFLSRDGGFIAPVISEKDLEAIRKELGQWITAWKTATPGTHFLMEYDLNSVI
jgi:hypothetical protein